MTNKVHTKFRIKPEYPRWVVQREQIFTEERKVYDMIGPKWLHGFFDAIGFSSFHWEEVPYYTEWTKVSTFPTFEAAEKSVLDRIAKEEKVAIEAPVFNSQEVVYYPKKRTIADALSELQEARYKARVSSHWTHIKSGKKVIIAGHSIRESDLTVLITYLEFGESASQSAVWTRPYLEFMDGRFKPKMAEPVTLERYYI